MEKHVAIILWCLATCSEYCTKAHLFGLARSTICVIFHDTFKAILSALQNLIIKFPNGDEHKEVVEGFRSTWGMIQCVGSIDGCHIPVMTPASGTSISIFIISGSAYLLSKFLMKPFAHNTALSPEQKTFSYTLSQSQIVEENAFGRLKAKW